MTEELKVKIQIQAETVKAKELMPGDLFSTAGPEYWANVNVAEEGDSLPIGEKVYVRTNTPVSTDEEEMEVTLVSLSYVRVDGKVRPSRSHESYHMGYSDLDEDGNCIGELDPNPKCPYCHVEPEPVDSGRDAQEAREVWDADSGTVEESSDATVS